MKVAIVADDLTGALDAAAPFARRGLATRVACLAGALPAALSEPADVVAVNTASRHLSADVAAAAVTAAGREIAAAAPDILFKKIDSTLRGQAVPETVALMEASWRGRVVFCPAAPSQGRTVKGGVVHVDGTPLTETSYARDALSPPAPDPVCTQFAHRTTIDCRTFTPEEIDGPEVPDGVSVLDCASAADLHAIARWGLAAGADSLFVGAVGLADALAEMAFGPPRPLTPPALDTDRIVLFVVGSRAPKSRTQCRRLAVREDVVVCDTPPGRLDAARLTRGLGPATRAVLMRTAAESSDADPMQVAENLGRATAALIADGRIGALVVTGGDTLAAALSALDLPVLDVRSELYPGIPLSRAETGAGPLWIVSKAGGFGDDDLFPTIVDRLGG